MNSEFKIGDKVIIKQFHEMDPSKEKWRSDWNWWGCIGHITNIYTGNDCIVGVVVKFEDGYEDKVHISSLILYTQYNRDNQLNNLGI